MTSPTNPAAKVSPPDGRTRCNWVGDDLIDLRYHDNEWGVVVHDDATLFEMLTLEGAQAGLSWRTVLRRREGYRRVFRKFNPRLVAALGDDDVERIMLDEGVIRHRAKILSVTTNARAILDVQGSHGSFDRYLWELGASDDDLASVLMSQRMRRDGFSFVGPTICRSLRQATGMVNEHDVDCFRRRELTTKS